MVHYGVGHTLTRRHTVSHLGTGEIFGKNVKDGLGISWNSPLESGEKGRI